MMTWNLLALASVSHTHKVEDHFHMAEPHGQIGLALSSEVSNEGSLSPLSPPITHTSHPLAEGV